MNAKVKVSKEKEICKWAQAELKNAIENKFTGKIEFNFFQGGISNMNKLESIKPPTVLKT